MLLLPVVTCYEVLLQSSSSTSSSYPVCSTKVIINLPYTFLLYKGIIGNDNRGIAPRFREDHRRSAGRTAEGVCQGEP